MEETQRPPASSGSGGSAGAEGVAIVTGGARGIGFACAQRLAQDGYRIAVLDVADETPEAFSSLPHPQRKHQYLRADVTSADDVDAAVRTISGEMGEPTVLVNNAGLLHATRLLDIGEEEWDRVMDVSVKGSFLCIRACLPGMIAAGFGRIVNISSTAGKTVSTVGGAHYTTAKTAVLGLTRASAFETAPHGITVNAVCPGLFDTEMVAAATTQASRDAIAQMFPIGRLGQPAEVANLVSFLCSAEAGYITGAAMDINGGDLMV